MLFSLALMILCGLVLSGIVQKLKLPGLVGMLLNRRGVRPLCVKHNRARNVSYFC